MFVILNFISAVVGIIQSLLQSNLRWILQLINSISNNLKKLLKYFSGTAIFTFLNTLLPSAAVDSPMKLDLYFKNVELTVEKLSGFPASNTGDSSLLNVLKCLNICHYIQSNYT